MHTLFGGRCNLSSGKSTAAICQNGQIVLNILPSAIGNLQLGNDFVTFNARFGGQPFALSIPVKAVLAIYARENGAGTVFTLKKTKRMIRISFLMRHRKTYHPSRLSPDVVATSK